MSSREVRKRPKRGEEERELGVERTGSDPLNSKGSVSTIALIFAW